MSGIDGQLCPDIAAGLPDENYGYSIREGTENHDYEDKFAEPVTSWDVHVYFDSSNEESTLFALRLRFATLATFPDLTVNRPYRSPIGPHTRAMWSCELHSPAQFARYLPWFCTRRGALSALVHPITDNELLDHTERCFWIGEKLPLSLDIFRM